MSTERYLVNLQYKDGCHIWVVDKTIFDWVNNEDPGIPAGMVMGEKEPGWWPDTLVPDCVKQALIDDGEPPEVIISSDSWDNDRAMAIPDECKIRMFSSRRELNEWLRETGTSIIDEYEGMYC